MSNVSTKKKPKPNWYPPWAPRFWNGMRLGDYLRLMKENQFKIHPIRYPMFALGGGCALINSILAQVQDVTHGSVIESAQLKKTSNFHCWALAIRYDFDA
jgi:hypothetical protein